MAETYEQYQQNIRKSNAVGSSISRVEAAMDQTELLQGVRARVELFVEAYEDAYAPELRALEERMRDSKTLNPVQRGMLVNMERDLQEVVKVGRRPDGQPFSLSLDDLKILLAQFPQKTPGLNPF